MQPGPIPDHGHDHWDRIVGLKSRALASLKWL